jgi:hypothetical protein
MLHQVPAEVRHGIKATRSCSPRNPPRTRGSFRAMSHQGPTVRHRLTAALVLSALALVALPALGLAASSDAGWLESCQSCEGCENGRCDDSSPFGTGHHCCLSSCLAHSVWTFSVSPSTAPSESCEILAQETLERPLRAVSQDIYEPPRS